MVFGLQHRAEEQVALDHGVPTETVVHVEQCSWAVEHDIVSDCVLTGYSIEDGTALLGVQPNMKNQVALDQVPPRLIPARPVGPVRCTCNGQSLSGSEAALAIALHLNMQGHLSHQCCTAADWPESETTYLGY